MPIDPLFLPITRLNVPLQLLLSASEDKRLILHDVRTSSSGKPGSGAVAALSGHSSWVLSTDISPDGRMAVSGQASI